MKIYETEDGINKYIQMAEGYDNSKFGNLIRKHLAPESSILELGMGPGNDYAWLRKEFQVTGSDYSPLFIYRARQRFPAGKFAVIDGISLDVEETFDAIYSCKVFQYFEYHDIETSLTNQYERLSQNGLIIHSFWIGDFIFEEGDMRAIYHNKEKLLELVNQEFEVLELEIYEEFEADDSIFLIAKKK